MKKLKIILLISLITSLNGCFIKDKDITQMVFPITILISKQNDKFQIYMLRLSNSLSSKIELESGLQDKLYSTVMYEGKTISEASEKVGVVTNGSISAIKIRSIILHDSLFENSNLSYKDITSYIINNPLYRTNIYVYYTKDKPEEILNINSLNFSTNTHFYLSRPDKERLNDFLLPNKLLDTAKSYVDNKRMFYLPSLSMTSKHVKQEESGELKEVNTYEINGGYFLTKEGNFKYVELEKLKGLKWKSKKEFFDVDLGDANNLLSVKVESLKWNTYIQNNQIHVKIKLISKINYNHTNLNIPQIEDKLKDYIYGQIIETYNYNHQEIDIYLFEDLIFRQNKKIENLDNFNLDIDAIIKNTIYEY